MSRLQQRSEELANTLTHAIGLVLAVGSTALLIALASAFAGAREIVSVTVFSIGLVLLYSASTAYHAVHDPVTKARLKILDHCAIFVLIAATYTPFTIAVIRGGWGWSLFAVVWGLAILGILFKLWFTGRFHHLSTMTYVAMGWLVVVAFVPLSQALTPTALGFLISGGVVYTLGTVFYHFERIPFNHAIWHVFVLAGSLCHVIAVGAQLVGQHRHHY